jgi:hypothetical protein
MGIACNSQVECYMMILNYKTVTKCWILDFSGKPFILHVLEGMPVGE